MSGYPKAIVAVGHMEPVPRRIRAFHRGEVAADTTDALYVWEWAHYPQYYLPRRDVRQDLLVPGGPAETGPRGTMQPYAFASAAGAGPDAPTVAGLVLDSPVEGLADTFRLEWGAFDPWFEEDEQVFVHPRNPYARVDALRSTRQVRIELEGTVLAESSSPVLVFETGLPTRHYLNRTEVRFEHLRPSPTVTSCPYKGTTSGYWSVVLDGATHADLAWSYDFPTRQLLPIAGLVAFYDEKVDVFLDGELLPRPLTHFSG